MKTFSQLREGTVRSADKKPEKYVGPDGKIKIRMVPVDREIVKEKSVSQAQQKAAGAALAAKRGEADPNELVGASKEMYKSMTTKELEDFASTKHKGLPKKVDEAAVDEISMADLKKNVSNAGNYKKIAKAHGADKLKQDLAMMRKKLATEAKDPNEYDQEGEMAKTQLRAIIKDAEHMIEMFEDDENLPEWVQKKIIKAQDYLNSAHTYMMNNGDDEEMNEQYVKTTPGHLVKTANRIGAKFDSKKQAYFKNGVKIGHVQTASGPGTAGLSSRAKETFYIHKKLKEEVELDEVLDSPEKMDRYRAKAQYSRDRAAKSAVATTLRNKDKETRAHPAKDLKTIAKRTAGLRMVDRNAARKFRKMTKEEVELDELSRGAITNYMRKADNAIRQGTTQKTYDKRRAGITRANWKIQKSHAPHLVPSSKAKVAATETTEAMTASQHRQAMLDKIKKSGVVKTGSMANETKAAPKGYHFTKDGKLKRGDADTDGPGGARLRADPLDKQRSKIPPVSEAKPDAAEVLRRRQQMKNISTSDKDKLLKVRQMLDKEKRK